MVSEQREQETAYILMVDNSTVNLKLVQKILGQEYDVLSAGSGEQALEMLEVYSPQLILLDFHLPGMDGAEIMTRIQNHPQWSKIPVIILTEDAAPEIEKDCFMMGAADFIVKPFVPMAMKSRISHVIELYGLRRDLEGKLEEKSRLVEKVSINAIMAIANTIDAKDAYTSGHSMRVALCAEAIAERLGWSAEESHNLYLIGLLHDIGKIGVPDTILNKPSRLSEREFGQIKKHPVIGAEILKNVRIIPGVSDGALYHHERYDGNGYPFGLKGEEIPLCARIIAIADTYDAMTSNRIYRAKLPDPSVVSEFERCSGTQFDPHLVSVFVEMLNEGFHVARQDRRRQEDAFPEAELSDEAADQGNALLGRALTDYSREKGTVDVLTGLSNRAYGESLINRLLAKGHSGAFVIVDLDDFSGINENYGHLVGDKVIKLIAATLQEKMEEGDVSCRLGGDEFVLFMSDVRERESVEKRVSGILEAFAGNMAQIGLDNVTNLSAGIAMSPADGKSYAVLYSGADKALYYVKRSGKASVSFYRGGDTVKPAARPDMDLDHIRRILEGRTNLETGVFKIPYEEFQNLYTYLSRCIKRNGQQVQAVLFALGGGETYLDNAVNEEAMSALEVAAAYSLRMVDVGSRFSNTQYIVILVDTNLENGRKVADRVINQFYKIYAGTGVELSYDIQTVTVKNEGQALKNEGQALKNKSRL